MPDTARNNFFLLSVKIYSPIFRLELANDVWLK